MLKSIRDIRLSSVEAQAQDPEFTEGQVQHDKKSMFIWIVIIIALISVLLSFLSLKNLEMKSEMRRVKKELSKRRVIYQDPSSFKDE